MIKPFIAYLIRKAEEKQEPIKFESDEYGKEKKKTVTKAKFNKKWFVSNYNLIYSEHHEVFEELEISGSPESIYSEYLVKKNKFIKNGEVFYDFICQIYINMTVPKLIMTLDD